MGAPRCRTRARVQRRVAAFVAVLSVAALTCGCGFVSALAHPDAPPTGVASSGATEGTASATDESAGATTAPATAAVSAAADLVASSYQRPASLTVSVTGVQKGVPPIPTMQGSLAVDCHL